MPSQLHADRRSDATPPVSERSRLPRSTPEAQGLSSAAVSGFLDGVAADKAIELHSLMILRHGSVVAEGWWEPYRRDDVHLLYSLSKSFTSTAVGFARAEGLLRLDRPAWEYLPGLTPVTDERLRRLTVRDALRMATGHRTDTLEAVGAAMYTPEPLQAFFDTPPEEEPGSIFCYNNGATYLVAAIVQQVSGQSLTDYLAPRLFEPLGIPAPYWQSAPPGRNIGFSGLHLTTESIARFGQTYLDRGVWQGRQLLPAGWTEEATAAHTPNPAEPEIDWRQGYGYQFWRSRHQGYRGDGAFGQFCVILPELDAVIVTTAATEAMQRLLDLVWHRLLPGFGETELADDHGRAGRLAERLAGLRLPLPADDQEPSRAALDHGLDHDRPRELNWDSDPGAEATPGTPVLVAVRGGADPELSPDDHDGVLWLAMPGTGDETRYPVPFAADGWPRAVLPVGIRRLGVAGSGGWTSPTSFTAEVTFFQTPHRLRIDVGPDQFGELRPTVSWRCAPLGSGDPAALAIG